MDDLVKRIRVRFSGLGKESQDEDLRRAQIRPKKAVQFKKESDNWFQRQFSGQMNDASDAEFLAAVAAAAYAISIQQEESSASKKKPTHNITSQVEESSMGKRFPSEELKGPPTRIKSKKDEETSNPVDSSRMPKWLIKKDEDISKPTDSSQISRWPSIKDPKEDQKEESDDDPKLQIKPVVPKKKMPEEAAADTKLLETTTETTLMGKGTPKFSNKNSNEMGHKKDEQAQTGQQTLPSTKPTASAPVKGNGRATHSSMAVVKADEWEAKKMAKIQKKHEKLKFTILEWENEKKMKAKRRLERKERQMELRRSRALQEYRNEESRVDKISGGARALAEEKRMNEEARAKEKANKIRLTGKVPRRCLCC